MVILIVDAHGEESRAIKCFFVEIIAAIERTMEERYRFTSRGESGREPTLDIRPVVKVNPPAVICFGRWRFLAAPWHAIKQPTLRESISVGRDRKKERREERYTRVSHRRASKVSTVANFPGRVNKNRLSRKFSIFIFSIFIFSPNVLDHLCLVVRYSVA